MLKHVLFYYSANRRTVALETLFQAVQGLGHSVTCLTTAPRGELHQELERHGIESFAYNPAQSGGPRYYLDHVRFLARFCRERKVDTVWSHLLGANLIAVLAQFLIKSRVVVFRHHFHFVASEGDKKMLNRNELVVDKIINKLARQIVVPSQRVHDGMQRLEAVDMRKVAIAPYIYDFSKYPQPNPARVREIEASLPCRLRIIMVARLLNLKRHAVVFPVFRRLIDEGLDIRVMVMDEGDEKPKLQQYVAQHGLCDRIVFCGFREDVIDYMSAAHLMVHPSVTEASNNAVKEIALLRKAVAVQSGVGDFDTYIVDGENGFLAPIEGAARAFEVVIRRLYADETLLTRVGTNLRETVLTRFSPSPASLAAYTRYL